MYTPITNLMNHLIIGSLRDASCNVYLYELFPYIKHPRVTRCLITMASLHIHSQEQDKSSYIEQQPPFGDRKTKYEAVHPTYVSENNS